MKQQEKQLLLKDLCARLPYGIYVRINEIHCLDKNEAITEGFVGGYCKPNMCQDYSLDEIDEFLDEGDDVKLYLRPLSSMTEDEEREFEETFQYTQFTIESYDWLLVHHFDFRGLIEKSLAIVAPEEMYKTEQV